MSNLPAFINDTFIETCEERHTKKWLFSLLCVMENISRFALHFSLTPPSLSFSVPITQGEEKNKLPTQQEVSSTKAEGLAVVTKLVNKDAKVTNITNLLHSNQVFMNHISVRQVFATLKIKKKKRLK